MTKKIKSKLESFSKMFANTPCAEQQLAGFMISLLGKKQVNKLIKLLDEKEN